MIEQFASGIISLLLAKFMLNDLPHAVFGSSAGSRNYSQESWKFSITSLGDSVRCTIGNIELLSKAVVFLPVLERLIETFEVPGGLSEIIEEAKVEGPRLAYHKVTLGDFLVYHDLGYLLPAGLEDDRRPVDISEVTSLVEQLMPLLTEENFVFDHGGGWFSATKRGSMAYGILHRAKYAKKWPVVIRYMESDRRKYGEASFGAAMNSCISRDLMEEKVQ